MKIKSSPSSELLLAFSSFRHMDCRGPRRGSIGLDLGYWKSVIFKRKFRNNDGNFEGQFPEAHGVLIIFSYHNPRARESAIGGGAGGRVLLEPRFLVEPCQPHRSSSAVGEVALAQSIYLKLYFIATVRFCISKDTFKSPRFPAEAECMAHPAQKLANSNINPFHPLHCSAYPYHACLCFTSVNFSKLSLFCA